MNRLFEIFVLPLSVFFLVALNMTAFAEEHKEKSEMRMPEDVDMHVMKTGGYKVVFHIMNMPVYHSLMKSMGVKHSGMEGGTSHHIMLEIIGPDGEKVDDAAVDLSVVDPRGGSEKKSLKPMKGELGRYGADFRMIHRGEYTITVEFRASGKMHSGGFSYEMK